ncbi:MAG: hypothetical protein AAFN27_19940, partial [Pseudomonadota bacterium]
RIILSAWRFRSTRRSMQIRSALAALGDQVDERRFISIADATQYRGIARESSQRDVVKLLPTAKALADAIEE